VQVLTLWREPGAQIKKNEKLILQATAQALYSGRTDAKRRLQLRSKDFFSKLA